MGHHNRTVIGASGYAYFVYGKVLLVSSTMNSNSVFSHIATYLSLFILKTHCYIKFSLSLFLSIDLKLSKVEILRLSTFKEFQALTDIV